MTTRAFDKIAAGLQEAANANTKNRVDLMHEAVGRFVGRPLTEEGFRGMERELREAIPEADLAHCYAGEDGRLFCTVGWPDGVRMLASIEPGRPVTPTGKEAA